MSRANTVRRVFVPAPVDSPLGLERVARKLRLVMDDMEREARKAKRAKRNDYMRQYMKERRARLKIPEEVPTGGPLVYAHYNETTLTERYEHRKKRRAKKRAGVSTGPIPSSTSRED